MSMNNRASAGVQDYAQKKRDAMDRARRAFREAKQGSILAKDLHELSDLVKAKAE